MSIQDSMIPLTWKTICPDQGLYMENIQVSFVYWEVCEKMCTANFHALPALNPAKGICSPGLNLASVTSSVFIKKMKRKTYEKEFTQGFFKKQISSLGYILINSQI